MWYCKSELDSTPAFTGGDGDLDAELPQPPMPSFSSLDFGSKLNEKSPRCRACSCSYAERKLDLLYLLSAAARRRCGDVLLLSLGSSSLCACCSCAGSSLSTAVVTRSRSSASVSRPPPVSSAQCSSTVRGMVSTIGSPFRKLIFDRVSSRACSASAALTAQSLVSCTAICQGAHSSPPVWAFALPSRFPRRLPLALTARGPRQLPVC